MIQTRSVYWVTKLLLVSLLICDSPSALLAQRKPVILVIPFENTGSKSYSWISEGIANSIVNDLVHVKGVCAISDGLRRMGIEELRLDQKSLLQESNVSKLSRMLGANVVFSGSYKVKKDRIRITANIINGRTGVIEGSTAVEGIKSNILRLQDEIVIKLVEAANKIETEDFSKISIQNAEIDRIQEEPTVNVSAYEWYSKGLEIQNADPEGAWDYFGKAAMLDPNYLDLHFHIVGWLGGGKCKLNERVEFSHSYSRAFGAWDKRGLEDSRYADWMKNIGIAAMTQGNPGPAIRRYEESRKTRELLGLQNTVEYTDLMMLMGFAYMDQGDEELALEYYGKSKEAYESLGFQNTILYADLMTKIGWVYYSEDINASIALEYYETSKKIREFYKLQNTDDYAVLMMYIGQAYYTDGHRDRAFEYYQKSKRIKDSLGLQQTKGYVTLLVNLGGVYSNRASQAYDKEQWDIALECYQKKKEIMEHIGAQGGSAYPHVLFNIARAYEKTGNNREAGGYFREAYEIYEKLGYSGRWKAMALDNAKRLGY